MRYDVIIIGGGPSGSRTALRMAENGFNTLVIDAKQHLDDPVCCTGIVGRECTDYYSIPEEVVYRNATGATIFSPSMQPVHIERSQPQATILNRPAFNKYLAEQAIAQGAEYRLNTRVTELLRTGNGVNVQTNSGVFDAGAVVIAEGFGSKLSQKAGFNSVPDFAMGVQAEVEAPALNEVEVFLGSHIAPGFFGWLVPTVSGKALAGIMSRRNTAEYMKKFLTQLAEQGRITDPKVELTFAGVALKQTPRASTDRILVVGSAAGQVKPITGGGVYYGMRCADFAADALKLSFEADHLTERAFSNYDKRWKQLLKREITISYWSRRFYERLSDPTIGRLFNIIQSRGVDKLLLESDDLRFDWHSAVILKLLNPYTLGRIASKSGAFFRNR